MNFDELQNAWNTPDNNLPTAQQQALAQRFARQMVRRRRFQTIWLINTFVWLTLITILAIWTVTSGRTKLAQEWALLPLLVIPWAFAIHFLRRYLQSVKPISGESPVIDTLQAALRSNLANQTQLKAVGALYVLMIPCLALSMRQLESTGKIAGRELISMAIFFGAILLVCAAGIAARYFTRLLPQQRQLDRVLSELAN
jgi:hypothetical protein